MTENPHPVHLEEVIDQHGYRMYVEKYPCETAGEPIGRVAPENTPESYPDIGELADPEGFEIAQVLMTTGISGGGRNRYLRMKRVSTFCDAHTSGTYQDKDEEPNAVEE